MKLSALVRRSINVGGLVFINLSCGFQILLFLCAFVLFSLSSPLSANAQDQFVPNETRNTSYPSYARPNVEADVPQNQHTLAQSVTIEVMAALICQLSGIDVIDPQKGCLGINRQTNKLGYVQNEPGKVGGLLGMGATMIGSLYTPPASGVSYLAQTVSDFGIVKNSFAQDCERGLGAGCIRVSKASGFGALQPVQKLWISVRNLTFILFVLVFVLIGIGIMLRVKIDPKAVMTLQNQLPKIVVALVLISFSYAIVGLVIDGMWLTTYAGINVITTADNPAGPECNPDAQSLREKSYRNILNYPVAFTSDIFDPDCERATGIGDLSQKVGIAIGTVLDDTLRAIINPSNGDCNPGAIIPGGEDFNWNACAASAFATIVYIIASVLGTLIAFVAMVIALFRLWFTLLKAYAYIIIYTITAPLWIMLGLLPNSSLGFGRWIKTVFANLIIFPLAAFVIITAKIILDAYKVTESEFFVTPLIGNPAVGIMGPLIAFGLILITPELLNTVRDALKTPASKFGGVMQAGFAAGAGPALAPIRAYGSRLTRFDPHKGEVGLVSGAWRNFSSKRLRGIGKYFSGTRKLENEENPLRH